MEIVDKKLFISPGRYYQGPGLLQDAGLYLKNMGNKALLIADETVLSLVGERLTQSLEQAGMGIETIRFNGECSDQEIDRLTREAGSSASDLILGAGGGKALDTAKVAGRYAACPVALVPTIAATDAPTSSIAVIYQEDHSHQGFIQLGKNPDLILADTEIIAEAPVRFLVSGMGDALATRFEAEACYRGTGKNIPGFRPTSAAMALARLCYDILTVHGLRAKWSVEKRLISPSLERVVEANILLSGLGFESGGLAAAHAIQVGFTFSRQAMKTFHGEKVAMGLLAQLFLEDRPEPEIAEVAAFNRSVGLPVTLEDLFVTEDEIPMIAEEACKAGVMKNMPFPVHPRLVGDAILLADRYGKTV